MLYPLLLIMTAASFSTCRVVELRWNSKLNDTLQLALGHKDTNLEVIQALPMPTHFATVELRQPETNIPYEGIPFPKQDWHGLRTPNYTDLYLNYTEPVYCIRTSKPIGFYGYMNWLVSCVVLAQILADSFRTREPSLWRVYSHLARVFFFLISVVRASEAYRNCSKEVQIAGGSYVVDGDKVTYPHNSFAFNFLAIPRIIDIITLAIQSLNLMTEAFLEKYFWLQLIMYIINILAFLATLVFSFFFYAGYTFFIYADGSVGGQIACVVVSLFLLILFVLVYVRFKLHQWVWDVVGPGGILPLMMTTAVILFHALCVGISYILLGRTIDDPWGATSCTGPLGKLHAALVGIVPVVTTIMSLLQ